MGHDSSNGYDDCADAYSAARSDNGLSIIQNWASKLPPGASVLDVGCGTGLPVTRALIDAGLTVSAIDASPSMVAKFQQNCPSIKVSCEDAERGSALGQKYDAIIAIGLIFLLPEDRQAPLLSRMCSSLKMGGRLLFTAPSQRCKWLDVLTGQSSASLGAARYRALLAEADLKIISEYVDEGESHYYDARKISKR